MNTTLYQEYRCPHDDKLLFKGILIDSTIEIKCKSCKKIIFLEGIPANEAICKNIDCQNRVR